MKKIAWENGVLVSKGKVVVNGIVYEVEPEQYEGNTPLTAENLNLMQDNIEEEIDNLKGVTFDKLRDDNITTKGEHSVGGDISDYDFILVTAGANVGWYGQSTCIIPVKNIKRGYSSQNQFSMSMYQSPGVYWSIDFYFVSNTRLNVTGLNCETWSNPTITKIYGIKL